MEPENNLSPEAKEAVHKAKNAAIAVELARQAQADKAADDAAEKAVQLAADKMSEKLVDEKRLAEIVRAQVLDVLSMGTEKDKTMIYAKVPYMCQDIRETKDQIKEINLMLKAMDEKLDEKYVTKQEFSVVRNLVFGAVGMILVAVVGALIALVVVK